MNMYMLNISFIPGKKVELLDLAFFIAVYEETLKK